MNFFDSIILRNWKKNFFWRKLKLCGRFSKQVFSYVSQRTLKIGYFYVTHRKGSASISSTEYVQDR